MALPLLLSLAVGLASLAPAQPCGKTLTRSGRLTSPGYPMAYPPNVRCKYTLRPQGAGVCAVELKFEELDVDGHAPRCDAGDAVLLRSTGERFCGVEPPPPLVLPISAEGLQMEFYANGQTSGTGFALRLTQIENSCPKKGSPCGGTFAKEHFRLEGPSAPGGACLYLLRKFDPTVCQVQVRFKRFSMGPDGACDKPRLLVAGRSLCGTRAPEDVETFDFMSQTLAFLYQPGDNPQGDKFVLEVFQEKCD
ncbi:procollagen C-endopeptidase enhancer 1-like [Amblyomma americanum]